MADFYFPQPAYQKDAYELKYMIYGPVFMQLLPS